MEPVPNLVLFAAFAAAVWIARRGEVTIDYRELPEPPRLRWATQDDEFKQFYGIGKWGHIGGPYNLDADHGWFHGRQTPCQPRPAVIAENAPDMGAEIEMLRAEVKATADEIYQWLDDEEWFNMRRWEEHHVQTVKEGIRTILEKRTHKV